MYSEKVLEKQLEGMIERGEIPSLPVLYSPEYSSHVSAHLDTLWDKESRSLKRPLKDDEKGFIANELLLSRIHYPYWIERYGKIIDFSKAVIPFKHNIAQAFFLSVAAEMEEEQEPIMIQLLKLRQLGMSSVTQRMIAHRNLFYPNTDSLVASNDPDKTRKLVEDNIKLTYDYLPWWQVPSIGKKPGDYLQVYDSGEVFAHFTTTNSAITIQHGTMKSGLARGSTPLCTHLTELPDFTNPKELVEGSLMNAVHENIFSLFILESTAAGDEGWWPAFWNTNKLLWPQRIARFRPLFIPWYVGTDVWPTSGWLTPARLRLLDKYSPSSQALAHAKRAREYVRSTPLLAKQLGYDYEIPKHQLMFWDYSRIHALASDNVKVWLQEVGAADDVECFQSAGTSIFPYELIESYRAGVSYPPVSFIVESDQIPTVLTTPPVGGSGKRVGTPISITRSYQDLNFAGSLVPYTHTTDTPADGRLLIWEHPLRGHTYTISYDDSEGLKKDSTAIQVIRNATTTREPEQVAEWASSSYNAFDAWPVLLAIATYYGSASSQDISSPDPIEPLVCVEIAVNGATVIEELRKRGYTNFYYKPPANPNSLSRVAPTLGWKTSPATRPKIISTLIKAIKDKWIIINSPALINELAHLEANDTQRTLRVEAQASYHDDRVMAIAIALVCSLEQISPSSISLATDRLEMQRTHSALTEPITREVASQHKSIVSFSTPLVRSQSELTMEEF